MKFATFALTALAGSAYAAPFLPPFTLPGGHDYSDSNELSRRQTPAAPKKFWGTGKIAIASVLAGGALGLLGGPVANRFLNDWFGVQTPATTPTNKDNKRSIHLDLDAITFDEARDLYISNYVDTILNENPKANETDAAVCTSVGYRISDPSATLGSISLKFSAKGQEVEYDCFVLAGPVTFEVSNATNATFAYEARGDATFEDGLLTIA